MLCENTAETQPSSSQGERPQKKPNLQTPGSWTSSLQNDEKTRFCRLTTHSPRSPVAWVSANSPGPHCCGPRSGPDSFTGLYCHMRLLVATAQHWPQLPWLASPAVSSSLLAPAATWVHADSRGPTDARGLRSGHDVRHWPAKPPVLESRASTFSPAQQQQMAFCEVKDALTLLQWPFCNMHL